MTWQRLGHGYVSSDGQYEMRGSYSSGHFAWRGRVIATDQLVWASADREYVRQCCERHAEKTIAEATA